MREKNITVESRTVTTTYHSIEKKA